MPHKTLKNNAEWALGIVTGDNKKYISKKNINGMEPIYKGSDVNPYRLSAPNSYIAFQPELFQQVAPEYKYRASEKLIYRFISNKLVFAYDMDGSLTLNSANILLPHMKEYPAKLILGLLNSKLYQFIYSKKFDTHKVLKGDIGSLPFPIMSKDEQEKIVSLVDEAIAGEDVQNMLDHIVMEVVGLTSEQVEIVMNL